MMATVTTGPTRVDPKRDLIRGDLLDYFSMLKRGLVPDAGGQPYVGL